MEQRNAVFYAVRVEMLDAENTVEIRHQAATAEEIVK
jgi:hypothetical protein